jgi:hypothetical protein
MPAGTEIMIAMEKPSAMITNNARIFLLEIFLTALVKTPNCISPFQAGKKKATKKERAKILSCHTDLY